MEETWRYNLATYMEESIAEPIEHDRREEPGSRNLMVGNGRWGSRHWRTSRPVRGRDGPQPDMGRGLSGFQLRIPARTRTTRCTGRVVGRNRAEESELDFGSRHSILFRQTPARLAGPVCGTSDRRQASRPPDPEMAEGGRGGRRTVVPDRGRESARVGDDSPNAKDNLGSALIR